MQKYYSNGKLLITGEYLVLDGANSLALPTKYGQDLVVEKIDGQELIWESLDIEKNIWFKCSLSLPNLDIRYTDQNVNLTKTLQKILKEAQKLNPEFLNARTGFEIKTNLNFQRNWGLGSSSTLINNIANWANIDAFILLRNSFGGSGYDIACAKNDSSITYKLVNNKPVVNLVNFNPVFKDQLYFIHLNKKQNSKEAINRYRETNSNISSVITEISQLTKDIIETKIFSDFEKIITEHENIIASIIRLNPIKKELFSDYFGQIKSLGAWGGDFVLATGNEDSKKYFKKKGYKTFIPYNEMIL